MPRSCIDIARRVFLLAALAAAIAPAIAIDLDSALRESQAAVGRDVGDYRICDEGSEFGTRVFRDGRTIEVPAGNRRGEKLRAGDEIYLGRACLRFERPDPSVVSISVEISRTTKP